MPMSPKRALKTTGPALIDPGSDREELDHGEAIYCSFFKAYRRSSDAQYSV